MRSEVKLAEEKYPVKLNDGGEAVVSIGGREGLMITLVTTTAKNSHSFVDLLQRARRNTLPGWARQVPVLVQRIEAVFAKERAEGRDPYYHVGITGSQVYYDDLRRGVRLSREIRDLKEDLARGRKLPDIYNVPTICAALGLA